MEVTGPALGDDRGPEAASFVRDQTQPVGLGSPA